MPTQRETILAALRGEELPERVPTEVQLILRDDEPGVTLVQRHRWPTTTTPAFSA